LQDTNPFQPSAIQNSLDQNAASIHTASRSAATKVRYAMVLLAMLVAVLLYLDRICLSIAGSFVQADLGLSKKQLELAFSAFFWTYALFQLPAGWLGDRFGARYVLAIYVAFWSLSTGLLGFANGLAALVALRLACGMFEAGAYPLAAGIVRRWIPQHRRGIANSVVAVGGRLGGMLAPILTIQLMMIWTYGGGWISQPADAAPADTSWRPVVFLYGVVGVIIAIIFFKLFRDHPAEQPLVNDAELAIIGVSREQHAVDRAALRGKASFPPIALMCKCQSLWLNSFVQFASNFGWAFLVTSMPDYLKSVHNTNATAQGWLQSLPLACGIIGLLLGGILLDRASRRFGLRIGRAVMLIVPRVLVGLAFFGCAFVNNAFQATVYLAVVGLATDLSISAMWAYGQDVGGKHVGSVVGWANMWGNLGAACSPLVLGYLARGAGWQTAFIVCGVIQLIAAVAALGINASKPLQPNHD
jgi:MFS family permease